MRLSVRPAFSLVDLMLTIAIVVILLAIVLFLVNPSQVLFDTNMAKTTQDAREIEKAITLYMAEEDKNPGDDLIPQGYENRMNICRYGLDESEIGIGEGQVPCIALDELIDGGYLPQLPVHFLWTEEYDDRILGHTVYWQGRQVLVGAPLINYAILFAEDTSAMIIEDNPEVKEGFDLEQDESFSIAIWYKYPASSQECGNILSKYMDDFKGSYQMKCMINQGNNQPQYDAIIKAVKKTGSTNSRTIGSGLPSPDGEYVKAVFVYDHTLSECPCDPNFETCPKLGQTVSFYRGGEHEPSIFCSNFALPTHTIRNTAPLTIGTNNGSDAYKGLLIDDIKFYSKAFTEEEVESLFAGDIEVNNNFLLHHWDFNEGEGNVARDHVTGIDTPLTDIQWSRDTASAFELFLDEEE